ncbi:MAG: trigger factor, partial [Planctomycetes bacterium]|nr:trigger factor [Planctomycetota bacterium]
EAAPPGEPAPAAEAAPPGEPAPAAEGGDGAAKGPTKLTQTVEMRDVGPCKKHIKVTVDRGAIDDRLKEKFSDLVKKSNVAGFRPGKAPRKVIEKRFHREVSQDVKNEVLLASLEQLAEEQDIAPLSSPNIDPNNLELPKQGDFVYEFEVEVRPQFDLPEYKGLTLKRHVYDITEEDIVKEQRRLLLPYGQVIPKPEGNAQVSDVLIGDATFKAGDQVISSAQELQLRVEKQLIFKDAMAPRFAEQVTGANPGDTRIVDLTLSSQAADPKLGGKSAQMELKIKDVKTIRLPELTHEFLHNFDVHSEEQFRELAESILMRRREYQQRQSAREQVMKHIAATSTWELPSDLLARQARKAMARRAMEMRTDGIPEQEVNNRIRLMQQDILQSTALALKEHFVLQKIAEVEKIEVSDDDLEAEIDRLAERSNESPRRVRARLEKDDLVEALAAEMIERMALDLILDSAHYEDEAVGEKSQAELATVEEQAVPGEMRDLEAEAVEAAKAQESQPPEGAAPAAEGSVPAAESASSPPPP